MGERVKIGRERFRPRIRASKPNPHRGDTRRHAANLGLSVLIQDRKDATVAMMGTGRHVTSLANQRVSRRGCRNVRLMENFSLRVWGIHPGGVSMWCWTHLFPCDSPLSPQGE